MRTNIIWTGRVYNSLENCLIDVNATGSAISSTIIGNYEGKIYKVEYHIITNVNWETVYFEINTQCNNQTQIIRYEGDGSGNWRKDGNLIEQFNSCIDVDISLTPFTNTLPIRRLKLNQHQSQEIQVIYCDLLAQDIKPVRQKYTCLSETEYRYENIPNDFEANIQVDEWGLVVDYPSMFVRTAAIQY